MSLRGFFVVFHAKECLSLLWLDFLIPKYATKLLLVMLHPYDLLELVVTTLLRKRKETPMFDSNVVVSVGKLTRVRCHSPHHVVVSIGKLTCIRFHSPCNVVVRNVLVLVPEGKLTCVSFPSWCNVLDGNVVVLI